MPESYHIAENGFGRPLASEAPAYIDAMRKVAAESYRVLKTTDTADSYWRYTKGTTLHSDLAGSFAGIPKRGLHTKRRYYQASTQDDDNSPEMAGT